MRIWLDERSSKMVFCHWSEHFGTRFLMHIFAYFGTLVHICISVHILGNFAYFYQNLSIFWHFLLNFIKIGQNLKIFWNFFVKKILIKIF